MAQAVLPKVGPNPKMTTMPTVEEKLIRSIVDADIGSGVAEEKIGTQATTATPKPAPVVPSGQTQAQSAMNQYGSRANNPQTVSEILMAQQSLRDLASTSTPPIQSMTQIAQLGFAIPGAVTMTQVSSPTAWARLLPTSPLSDLEFDEDYQDAKSQLEAAGYVVDENGIVRTTTGKSVGPLSEVVNFGRANPGSGGPAGVCNSSP
jgi:hypothetical protein